MFKLFYTTTCPECQKVKDYLLSKEWAIDTYNVEEVEGLAEWSFLGIAESSAPVLVEGEVRPFRVTIKADNIITRLEEIYGAKE